MSLLLGAAQFGLGVFGGLKARKASKKARKRQKRLIAQRIKMLNELGAQYQAGGRFYEAAQKGLRTRRQMDIQDIMAAKTRGFTKTTTAGAVRERYMAKKGGGRDQQMNLEEWLAEKYRGVQMAKSQMLGQINIKGPSSQSISNAFAQAGQGLSTMLDAWQNRKVPTTAQTHLGSDITEQPEPVISAPDPVLNRKMYRSYQGLISQY